MVEKFASDEEFKNQRMTEMVDMFNAADANKDGRLDADEWMVWCKAQLAKKKERGEFEDDREDHHRSWYATTNKVDPSAEGVAIADFYVTMGISMAKMLELKAAGEAQ